MLWLPILFGVITNSSHERVSAIVCSRGQLTEGHFGQRFITLSGAEWSFRKYDRGDQQNGEYIVSPGIICLV